MKKLKVGVLSTSNHLVKRIVLPLQNTKNCEIYAIASRDIKKAQQFAEDFNIQIVHESYQNIIDDPSVDIVYIPLPNHLHLEWVKKAANAGKHILCEKPIALNTEEAIKCFDVAKKNNVLLMEAFMYKFHPQWQHAKNTVKTKQIGDITYIRSSFAYSNPSPSNIRNIKGFGGGALMDIGCYAISVPRFILDMEPQKVISLQQTHQEFNTDFLSSGILDFNGIHASYTVGTLSQPNQSVEIIGTGGSIKIEIPFNTYVDTKAVIEISTPQGLRNVVFDAEDQYGLMFDAFAEAIINKGNSPINIEDAINNMKVIDAVSLSATSQQWEIL
ncbi:Gfo/Idh/MocA family protein [Labilibacter marinus]|uniref:Gfo/Idh/MocA family protein n=1 Tax=Labilibacter marinus TaxID=1477105 RepID=UPI00082D3236|nr:Gfo/Idh/MocA family oxidoreductase [Labilibacter marinus]